VVVNAAKPAWQGDILLQPNSTYVIVPSPSSRWTIDNSQTSTTYEGSSQVVSSGSTPISGNWRVRLSSLTVLVWHAESNGPGTPEVFSFTKGQQFALVRTGQKPAEVNFICSDLNGAYSDNSGVMKVEIVKDEENSRIKADLPITARRGSAKWSIDSAGGVECAIKFTVGAGSGSKRYASGVVVEFRDGSTYHSVATATIGRPPFGTKSGTKTVPRNSIPANKLREIRRVYVTYDVTSSINSVNDHINNWVEILKEADRIYKELKGTELVKDAVSVSVGGTEGLVMSSASTPSIMAAQISQPVEMSAPISQEIQDGSESTMHSFRLRDDFTLELTLPSDLSQSEARRLQNFIKALPLNDK